MSYANGPRIVTDGLVLHLDAANRKSYPLSGNTIYDLSGNGNNGTFGASTAAPAFSSDNGGCIVFAGDDYVSTPVNIDANPSSIGTWFNASTTSGTRGIVLTDNLGWDKGFEINNNIFSIHAGDSLQSTGFSASINTWYYGFLMYTSSSMSFYINGINVWNGGTPGATSGSTVEIGRAYYPSGSGSRFFQGKIAQVSIYNRALSANEVQQNYNALKGRYGL